MSAGPAAYRLELDWTRCDGHGVCAALLPQQITRDEWGYPLVHSAVVQSAAVAPGELRAARRAVATCPALALRLTPIRKDPLR